jgi:hypothetical protein
MILEVAKVDNKLLGMTPNISFRIDFKKTVTFLILKLIEYGWQKRQLLAKKIVRLYKCANSSIHKEPLLIRLYSSDNSKGDCLTLQR